MEDLLPNENVSVRHKFLHGGSSLVLQGQVVATNGDSVTVAIEGEYNPRQFPRSSVTKAPDSDNPYAMPTVNAIRRQF